MAAPGGPPGTPLPPVCVCVWSPPACLALSVRPPAPLEPLLLTEPPGLEGTGAELWSLPATGVAGSLQEPGSWAAVWGQKQRFFPLPQKNSLSPDGYLSCVNIWRRDIYCCCWRGVIASGKEGRGGAGPFQQRPQEPHTPFYKKYTNILLTFLHRFFFPPPPSSSKNNPVILFFFFLCTACSQSRTRNYLQAMYRGRVSSSASPPTSACPGGSFWPPQRRAWKEKQGLRARQSPPPA